MNGKVGWCTRYIPIMPIENSEFIGFKVVKFMAQLLEQ